jgi:hypothetical protein
MPWFRREKNTSCQDTLNLSRKSVAFGGIELPLPNLNALCAIRTLTAENKGDELQQLLAMIWVLRHQQEDRILEVGDRPPTSGELAEVGREISGKDLPKYCACLQEMFLLLGEGKAERKSGR